MKKRDIIILIVGIIIGTTFSVIAETSITSNMVSYDNTISHSETTNVKGALDDLYNGLNDVSSIIGEGMLLRIQKNNNLSKQLIAGLYRYQGVQDANNNVDNYICFGTTNKNTCVNDTDKYMYRIIGITANGQMKLIKKEALNNVYQWDSTNGVDWPNSSLFNGLNGSYFLTNTNYVPDDNWNNRIAVGEWHYSNAHYQMSASDLANSELEIGVELENQHIVNAKIGLIYAHDYFYGLAEGNECVNSAYVCKKSWIFLWNNYNNNSNLNETTLTRLNDSPYNVLSIGFNGNLGYIYRMETNRLVRPVFYLRSSEEIASGTGSITDPFILV